MANYLITGCSRGLGLALATQLAALPSSKISKISASARSETPSLQRLVESSNGRVVFVKLDATNESDINNAVKHVESVLGSNGGLDVLINNAGVMPFTPDGVQAMTEVMWTNVTSAQMVTSAFLPLLSKGAEKKVFNI